MHPNMPKKISISTLLCTGFLCSCALADPTQPMAITEDRVNLSAAEFLPEFISKSPERRTAARLYLLGVLDSSEGKTWCSYNQIKTVTINEFVFEYLKKQPAEKLKPRASALIEEALHQSFPCKEAQ
ncbi:MAG: hypothetical protein K0Q67_1521 [Cellvibrio sp.]|jgi:hypothetical protein|nr:hypothetical protein [Cellvibrio sp.]